MKDPRIKILANKLINYSVRAKAGDRVMIEAFGVEPQIVSALCLEAAAVGAYPFPVIRDHSVMRAAISCATEKQMRLWANYDGYMMDDMDCYIGIRGGNNTYELSDVPPEKNQLYNNIYSYSVHHEKRVANTRWVVLRYPTPNMAQQSGVSTEAFEDFYFDVCNLDYAKMESAMEPLKKLMSETDRVRLVAPGTELTFSIKGIGAKKCCGHRNIPDGEVYSAPVKNSVNGTISYNAPSVYNGTRFENVKLTFKEGRIVDFSSSNTQQMAEILSTDDGAKFVGEFALGLNPYITKPMGDILFDEKISGSIHFTPGCAYDDCDNGNRSSVHWDLVLIMTEKYGGGEIYFDDKLIRKNGIFVLPELKGLNPENLV